MAAESVAAPSAISSARTRIALVLLLLIVCFIGYGVFERSRLFADAANEKKATQEVRSLQGMVIDSMIQDWRVIFVPDQPQIAMRVGGVYIPHEGDGPDYTKRVAKQLRAFAMCNHLNISNGPLSEEMRMGPAPKRVLKPGEIPPEPLDLAAILKEFPHLKVSGEEYLLQAEDNKSMPAPSEAALPPTNEEPAEKKSAGESEKKEP